MNRSKAKRILQRMVNSLFKLQAFVKINSFDDIKNLDDYFGQELTLSKEKTIFITTDTRNTLRSITSELIVYYDLEDYITFSEIFSNVKKIYADYILNKKSPENMIDDVYELSKKEIRVFNNINCCEGIKLNGIEQLNCGEYKIISSDFSTFLKAYGKEEADFYEMMKDYLWICGSEKGSKKQVEHKFDYKANLITSFLSICLQTINKKSILNYRIQALNSSSSHKSRNLRLQWANESQYGSFSYSFPKFSNAEIDLEILKHFKTNLFFDEFFTILEKELKTEVEDAIIKSVYWFCEATKDNNDTMKFIKLWSCIECFFSITQDEISESNAKGLACILVYGGYRIHDIENYREVKSKIKKMYKKRSKALHRAYWSDIEANDVVELADWTAWLIISILGLAVVGNYTRLSQIKEQTVRLDNIHNEIQ